MCTSPVEQDGLTFACRVCNECVATRRHGWVARAMMEKALWPNTLILALTYGNETQEQRDASAMFQYRDVSAFLKRLRKASHGRAPGSRIRFLCAGEQGTRKGRCHWHVILFSDVDLRTLGEVDWWGRRLSDPDDMLTMERGGKMEERRLHWSIWGNGFVTMQHADEGGMAYVLSYCLKDLFTAEKSRGTMREAKSEAFATGLFRMSKRPAIGSVWLHQRLQEIGDLGAVLPSLKFKVPGMRGYYVPAGSFRKVSLDALAALNQMHRWKTGADSPQMSSLRASLLELDGDLARLDVQETEKEACAELERAIALRAAEGERLHNSREHARECGRRFPCEGCLRGMGPEERAEWRVEERARERWDGSPYWAFWSQEAQGWVGDQAVNPFLGRENPGCRLGGSVQARRTFPASGRPAP